MIPACVGGRGVGRRCLLPGTVSAALMEGPNMDHSSHNKIVSFIWSIADDCLRDVFVRGKYHDVILPMFVLRRIDCLVKDTKAAVLEEVRFQKEEAKLPLPDADGLRHASGQVFYNISRFTLKTLLGNPSQLVANLENYLNGYSENVREIIAKFDLATQVRKMAEANALFGVIEKFVSPEINLSPHDTTVPPPREQAAISQRVDSLRSMFKTATQLFES